AMFALWPSLTGFPWPAESLPQRSEIGSKKSARVKRLTPGALAICENTIVCNITVRRSSSWAQVHIPSSSTSKPVAARRGLCGEWYPSHLRSLPGASSSRPLFFRSHMTTLGRLARLTIPATVRIPRGSGPVQTLNVNIEVGRKFFHFMHADDQAASVQLNPPAGFRPQVSAMVEYTTP